MRQHTKKNRATGRMVSIPESLFVKSHEFIANSDAINTFSGLVVTALDFYMKEYSKDNNKSKLNQLDIEELSRSLALFSKMICG